MDVRKFRISDVFTDKIFNRLRFIRAVNPFSWTKLQACSVVLFAVLGSIIGARVFLHTVRPQSV